MRWNEKGDGSERFSPGTRTIPHADLLGFSQIGTNQVATRHRRQAEMVAQHLPIRIHPLPIQGSSICEMKWHRQRQSDSGLQWLLELVRQEARRLHFA